MKEWVDFVPTTGVVVVGGNLIYRQGWFLSSTLHLVDKLPLSRSAKRSNKGPLRREKLP